MLKFKPPVVLQLQEGQLVRCDQAARAATLRVVRGRVWVTRAHDPGDHFLRPGMSLRIEPGSHALLSAETDAQVAFSADSGWLGALAGRAAAVLARRGRSGPGAGAQPGPAPG